MKKFIRNVGVVIGVGLHWTIEAIAWIIAAASDIIYRLARMTRYGALMVLYRSRKDENPIGYRGHEFNQLIDGAKNLDEEMASKLEKLRVK